jgi:hypothetical protein
MDADTESKKSQRKWKPSQDGKAVSYAGTKYLPAKAPHALGLTTRQIINLKQGILPNGEVANVIQDTQTREVYFSQEVVDRLKGRFIYADNEEPLGPCRVHSGHWSNGLLHGHSRLENSLRPVSLILRDISRRDKDAAVQYKSWIDTAIGPNEIPVRKVRDTMTGDHLLSLRTISQISEQTGYASRYRA